MSAVPQFGEEISAGGAGTKALLLQAYLPGLPHQWAVETWRNPVQVIERHVADGSYRLRGNEEIMFDFVSFDYEDDAAGVVTQVWKRRVWNNGPPMDPINELLPYFRTVAVGGGSNRFSIFNPTGQFGQGTRASILPHSDLMVITTQPGGESHAVMLADSDPSNGGSFVMVKFSEYVEDDQGKVSVNMVELAPLDGYHNLVVDNQRLLLDVTKLVHPTVRRDGGVTFILNGRDYLNDYIEGDQHPRKLEKARRLVDDLTKRLHSPYPVTVTYLANYTPVARTDNRVHTADAAIITVDSVQKMLDPRPLKTYNDWFARVIERADASGLGEGPVVMSDGTEIDVYLLPVDWNWQLISKAKAGQLKKAAATAGTAAPRIEESDGKLYQVMPSKDSWLPYDGMGFVVAQYGYEMMPVHRKTDGSEMRRNDALLKWWVGVPSVADRTAIVIRPPLEQDGSSFGVTQNSARSALQGPNGSSLPLDQWREEFFDLMPAFLKKALREANPHTVNQVDPAVLKRIKEQLAGRLALEERIEYLIDAHGDLDAAGTGTTTEGPPPHEDKGVITDPAPPIPREPADPNGTGTRAAARRVQTFMPNYKWLTADEWAERATVQNAYLTADGLTQQFCVVDHSPAETTLFFNEGHPIYKSQHLYYTSAYFSEKRHTVHVRRAMTRLSEVPDIVKNAYVEVGISLVFWAHHRAKDSSGQHHPNRFKELTESDLMTQGLGGYVNVDPIIKQRIGNL